MGWKEAHKRILDQDERAKKVVKTINAANTENGKLRLSFKSLAQELRFCEAAARLGSLRCLEAVHQRRGSINKACDFGAFIFAAAARCGRLDILQWLKSKGCPWGRGSLPFQFAAFSGHIGAVRWLRENGCKWDKDCWAGYDVTAMAALGGHLELLQWLHAEGCPWNRDTCAAAARGCHTHVLEWATAHGCEWSYQDIAIETDSRPQLLLWMERQHTAMMQLLARNPSLLGCTEMRLAIPPGYRALLGYLAQQRAAAVLSLARKRRDLPSDLIKMIVVAAELAI